MNIERIYYYNEKVEVNKMSNTNYLERLELFNEKAEIIKKCKFTKYVSRKRVGGYCFENKWKTC